MKNLQRQAEMRSEGHFKNVFDQSSALHQLRTIFYVVFFLVM